MVDAIRKLWLAFAIIAAAGAVLVATDASRQRGTGAGDRPRIVVLYHSSIQPVVDALGGFDAVLREARGVEGIEVRRLNSEGDMPTLRQMAADAADSGSTLTVTLTTPALQAFAGANQRHAPHVFGLVVDPFVLGIGLDADRREEHPDWITGIASPPPIARLMAVLKQCNPAARRVGVAWNPAESNAVASLKIARAAMAAIGLELVEANAATTGEVRTAVDSLLGSGIDAFWIPPDINAQNAAPSILTACRAARVPVFASFQKFVGSGAAVGVGADYDAIGREVGRLVVRILDGEPIASIPVADLVPQAVWIDPAVFARCAGGWKVPPDLAAEAAVLIGERDPPAKGQP